MKYISILSILLILAFANSCAKVEVIQDEPIELSQLDFNYDLEELDLDFDEAKVQLGRVLFYDDLLSLNGKVSCGSCHRQEYAFGDNQAFSEGFEGKATFKNTPTLVNVHLNSTFMWDSRITTIVSASLTPAFDSNEMGLKSGDLVNRVNHAPHYGDLIAAAFPEHTDVQEDGTVIGTLKINHVGEALAEFIKTLTAVESKFDIAGKASSAVSMSKDEEAGLELFRTHCNSCHTALGDAVFAGDRPPVYYGGNTNAGFGTVNIGLDLLPGQLQQVNSRIPTLRNIGSSAPYMHDGRFETLREVIDHYDDGVKGERIDARLLDDKGAIKKLNLSDTEKDQLERFLLTLTDATIETAEKWSDPFIK